MKLADLLETWEDEKRRATWRLDTEKRHADDSRHGKIHDNKGSLFTDLVDEQQKHLKTFEKIRPRMSNYNIVQFIELNDKFEQAIENGDLAAEDHLDDMLPLLVTGNYHSRGVIPQGGYRR